ncbi:MAG TPA: DUF4118 domain-containing protein, partial [Actinomycetota bacterium]|nr:DUF4118 domain-containing protein [Actinomycetota bacterium]
MPETERRGGPTFRAAAVGLLATLVAGALAYATEPLGEGSAVAVLMLGVTIAAVTGGLWGGVVASIVSSVVLPLLTDPGQGFVGSEPRDLIAAVVFLAV